jgi:demethylmenaquinone methyltransferase/2-methoxy-6-polyprenyl-1,4-benzoquinol methylase
LAKQKEAAVKEMFGQIAPTYDLLNTLLSLNIHKRWRPVAVAAAHLPVGGKVLDLATGTGDLALLLARTVGPAGLVVGADYCEPMLRIGQRKVRANHGVVRLAIGSADHLPFADESFDAATMGFALRNVPDRENCLREMARVVRSGGWVVNLDLTRPKPAPMAWFYRLYQDKVMPTVGGWISGRREAYQYLPQSIQEFPPPEAIAETFRAVGLEEVSWQSLTCGVATVHSGRKR